ncbi:unnamed protein product, partial [Polarella glacialis]
MLADMVSHIVWGNNSQCSSSNSSVCSQSAAAASGSGGGPGLGKAAAESTILRVFSSAASNDSRGSSKMVPQSHHLEAGFIEVGIPTPSAALVSKEGSKSKKNKCKPLQEGVDVGSEEAHVAGTCKPCMFVNSGIGCSKGTSCVYCHRHPKSTYTRPSKL